MANAIKNFHFDYLNPSLTTTLSNLSIDYRDENNTFTNEEEAKILVPVSGPSGEGNFYLHAVPENDGYWQAKRCELKMTKCSALDETKWKGKRLVVFDQV